MPADARWAAVVVAYEAGPLLVPAVQSLVGDDSAGPVELVVVDNGSVDGSVAALRDAVPDVAVVQPGANLGYSRAANLGIASTRAPIVAVANPDVVLERGSARAVLDRFDAEPDLGAAGPDVRNHDGTRYPTGRNHPGVVVSAGHAVLGPVAPGNPFTRRYHASAADPGVPRDADWVSGALVWLRRRALDQVGGWDERYFLFMEDVDLCRRLRGAGWRVAYEPAAVVTHLLGRSRAQAPYRSIVEHHRSAYRYAATWWHGPQRVLLPLAAAGLAARAAIAMGAAGVRSRRGAPGGAG